MADSTPATSQLHHGLACFRAGDPSALDGLLRHVGNRLERLTHRLLRDYPGVQRWQQTDDVLQSALMRLLRALRAVQPASMREFFALATEQIRRELLDLVRHFYGPEGPGAHHASHDGRDLERADQTHEPSVLAEWCEFHRLVDALPEDEREVVGLLYYQELTQAEAAAVLGVTVRTVQRRWQTALLNLHRTLKGNWPSS